MKSHEYPPFFRDNILVSMKRTTTILIAVLSIMASCKKTDEPSDSNIISNDRMLLVLSAPSVYDTYYTSAFQLIVDFQINYAKAIMGN